MMSGKTLNLKGKVKISKRLLAILGNPYLIALEATIVLVLIINLFWQVDKFNLTIVNGHRGFYIHFYEDLDNNGYSDHITVVNNAVGTVGVSVQMLPQNVVEQWNFRGQLNFETCRVILTGDYDNIGIKEIYSFSVSNDSIYLNYVLDLNQKNGEQTFITKVRLKNGKCDPLILPAKMEDLDDDGYGEVIFGISTGFSVCPRNVFSFSPLNGTIQISPKSAAAIMGITQADITGDGKSEFLLVNYTPGNLHDSGYTYHDSSSWLMILDSKLQFLFPPVECSDKKSTTYPFVLQTNPQIPSLFTVTDNAVPGGRDYSVCNFNSQGKMISQKTFGPAPINSNGYWFKTSINEHDFLVSVIDKRAVIYDPFLNAVKRITLKEKTSWFANIDLDLDGDEEIIMVSDDRSKLQVFRNNLKNSASVTGNFSDSNYLNLSLKYEPGKLPMLSVQAGKFWYLLSYNINPLFYWRWAIYAGIYLSILIFTLVVQRIQRLQLQRKYNTEKKITELQLKIVRNQMEPHFAMNALTSIMASIENQGKEEAAAHMEHFVLMYRSLVLSSDKFSRTLKEEMEFTENYMKMQQFLLRDNFRYKINIASGVNMAVEVPKMIVQSHVENAVKHGLRHKKDNSGLLEIDILMAGNR
ncbi:MAG: histidine kinase, partial [Bacteroidetes bacterium]|nr:histidine kinase [Bacteroidota bacterium]